MSECMSYFKNLFQSEGTSNPADIPGCVTEVVIDEMNKRLLRPYTNEENKFATFQLEV